MHYRSSLYEKEGKTHYTGTGTVENLPYGRRGRGGIKGGQPGYSAGVGMLYFRDIRFRKQFAAEPSCGDGEAHGGRGADPGSTGKPHE